MKTSSRNVSGAAAMGLFGRNQLLCRNQFQRNQSVSDLIGRNLRATGSRRQNPMTREGASPQSFRRIPSLSNFFGF